MGNVLTDQCRFFTIPQEFVESGRLRDCSPSAVKLYTVLYYFAQKHSAVRLEFSNAQLKAHAGLDTKSISSARDQLRTLGQITFQKGSMGVYTYVLLNPITGTELPAPQGRTGIKRYQSSPKAHRDTRITDTRAKEHLKVRLEGLPAGTTHDIGEEEPSSAAFRCFSCKRSEFWMRGGERICARCHPDPKASTFQRQPLIPSASELGF